MYELLDGGYIPIKAWTKGVEFEHSAKVQLRYTSQLPVVGPHIAVMPDVHLGIGSTVGSVIPTRKALIPAAVGVDIGCGMMATRTTLTSHDLGDSARDIYLAFCKSVPHGSGKNSDVGNWEETTAEIRDTWGMLMDDTSYHVLAEHKIKTDSGCKQLGTLGGGNHFVELCLDEEDRVWIMLHSGSRGIGNKIGTYFIELAKKEMERLDRHLPNRDLAYLEEGTEHFHDYFKAMLWAQRYAKLNRGLMMRACVNALKRMGLPAHTSDLAVQCHHNFCQMEIHFGEVLYVTRKGAVSAKDGELGIIPGSMGTRSFIVRGKGNPESFESCSHGAGRVMPRGVAKRTITLEQHAEDTKGVICGKDHRVLDESPRAYKDVDAVMAAQSDLVEIVHTLKQVLCVKG